jgi:hypothetical protein
MFLRGYKVKKMNFSNIKPLSIKVIAVVIQIKSFTKSQKPESNRNIQKIIQFLSQFNPIIPNSIQSFVGFNYKAAVQINKTKHRNVAPVKKKEEGV